MKILKIQALRGPNIWSITRKKLIQMRLDLEDLEEKPTNKISQIQQKVVDAGLKDLLGPKGVDGRFGPYTADAVLQLLNKK